MYSLIRQLNQEGRRRASDAGRPLPRRRGGWWRPAERLVARGRLPSDRRGGGVGARASACCFRRRSAGGPSGAIGTERFMAGVGPRDAGRGLRWCWSWACAVLPVLGPARRPDAGDDGGSPGGAAAGRGRHGTSGTLAGRRAMTRFGRTIGRGWSLRRSVLAALRRPARWRGAGARGPAGARRAQPAAGPDRHRPPHRQLARARDPVRRRCTCPRWEPIHLGGLATRSLAHQAPGLHAARGDPGGAGLPAERARRSRGPRRGAGRPRDSPARWRRLALYIRQEVVLPNVGPPRRGIRALPADAVLLHPGDEPAGPAALGRHRHRQHRGDRGARGHGVPGDRSDRHADAGPEGLPEDHLLPAVRACRAASAAPSSRCCCWPS